MQARLVPNSMLHHGRSPRPLSPGASDVGTGGVTLAGVGRASRRVAVTSWRIRLLIAVAVSGSSVTAGISTTGDDGRDIAVEKNCRVK